MKDVMFLFLFGVFLLLDFATFVTAYRSDSKSVLVQINNYGEADLELFALSLLLIGSAFVIYEINPYFLVVFVLMGIVIFGWWFR